MTRRARAVATARRHANDRALLGIVARVVALSLLYRLTTSGLEHLRKLPAAVGDPVAFAAVACVGVAALLFRHLAYSQIWAPLRVLVRGTVALIAVQLAFDAFYPTSLFTNLFMGLHVDLRILTAIGLAFGVVAVLRPAFAMPTFVAYICERALSAAHYRLPMPFLDVRTFLDVGLFSATALVAWTAWRRGRAPDATPIAATVEGLRVQKIVWAIGVGIHLGNYFHSGLAKMRVGLPDPLFWAWHNPTAQPLVIGLFRWNNPFAGWPALVQGYADLLSLLSVPINLFVLAIQICAPLSVVGRRTMIAFTLAFDVMHLAIYGSLGAFFFYWIALNVLILASLARMRDAEFTPSVRVTVAATAVLGWLSFWTATLGWLDGGKVVREIVVAHDASGRSWPIPPALFGSASYQFGHGELWAPPGHFPIRKGGNVKKRRDWADATSCGPLTIAREQGRPQSLATIARLVADMDGYYRAHPWIAARGLEYGAPLHMPSNPALFADFDARPFAAATGYSYVVQSACPRLAKGRLEDDVRIQSSFPLDLGTARDGGR